MQHLAPCCWVAYDQILLGQDAHGHNAGWERVVESVVLTTHGPHTQIYHETMPVS